MARFLARFRQNVATATRGLDPDLSLKGWGRNVLLLCIDAQLRYPESPGARRRHVLAELTRDADARLNFGDGPVARWLENIDGVILGFGIRATSMALQTPIEVGAAVLDAMPDKAWPVLKAMVEARADGEPAPTMGEFITALGEAGWAVPAATAAPGAVRDRVVTADRPGREERAEARELRRELRAAEAADASRIADAVEGARLAVEDLNPATDDAGAEVPPGDGSATAA